MLVKPSFETDVTKLYEKHWVTDFEEIEKFYNQDSPTLSVIDAETTGLHIIQDKPFMWVFGWLLPRDMQTESIIGRVFAFEQSEEMLDKVFELFAKTKISIGHNLKFDLHMMINGGVEAERVIALDNIIDTMGVCRLVFDAVSARDGGDLLGLKKVTEKYIDEYAEEFEKEVKKELQKINNEKRDVLKENLTQFRDIGWGIGKLKDAYKAKKRNNIDLFTKERKHRWIEVPKEVEEMYFKWMEEYPFANYSEVSNDVMVEYVHSDGIYTLEVMRMFYPEVLKRGQKELLLEESKLLTRLLKMERVGMPVDMEYLRESFIKCDNEIQRMYEELWELVGDYTTVSQRNVIGEYFEKLSGEVVGSMDKAFLGQFKDDRVAELISSLRRLEKWQATYISGIMEVSERDEKFFTQYQQFGTVSGRLSSNAQQFPSERILTEEGEKYEKDYGEGRAPQSMEIFFPRRAFVTGKGKYSKIAYMDLSQIELRAQANYSILLGKPDLNLCRAYMPLYCKHYLTGEEYKFKKEKDRSRWGERTPDGNSAWLDEEGNHWVPTDLHSETAHNALVSLGYESDEKYKVYGHQEKTNIDAKMFREVWRPRGKTFNFMREIYSCACKTHLNRENPNVKTRTIL